MLIMNDKNLYFVFQETCYYEYYKYDKYVIYHIHIILISMMTKIFSTFIRFRLEKQ
jgi:hypothetical protein